MTPEIMQLLQQLTGQLPGQQPATPYQNQQLPQQGSDQSLGAPPTLGSGTPSLSQLLQLLGAHQAAAPPQQAAATPGATAMPGTQQGLQAQAWDSQQAQQYNGPLLQQQAAATPGTTAWPAQQYNGPLPQQQMAPGGSANQVGIGPDLTPHQGRDTGRLQCRLTCGGSPSPFSSNGGAWPSRS